MFSLLCWTAVFNLFSYPSVIYCGWKCLIWNRCSFENHVSGLQNKVDVLKCQSKCLSPHQLHKFFDINRPFLYYHPLYYQATAVVSFKSLTGRKARETFSRFSRLKASDYILPCLLFCFSILSNCSLHLAIRYIFFVLRENLSKCHFIYHK
jgi:hypothetical protein